MLYAMICNDKPNCTELRSMVRTEHLAYLASLGDAMKFAGPFVDEAGSPTGSLVMIEAESSAAAAQIAALDPYKLSGLFISVEIRPWKWALKNPEAK